MSLSSIRARVEAASPAPWIVDERDEPDRVFHSITMDSGEVVRDLDCVCTMQLSSSPWWQEDRDFIAHARTDIPLLLKVAEAMREDVKGCATWCDEREGCLACHQYARCRKRIALAELEAE